MSVTHSRYKCTHVRACNTESRSCDRSLHGRPDIQHAHSFTCSRVPSAGELGQVERIMWLRVESQKRGRGALSLWQTGTEHRGGCVPIASQAMSGHAIGPRDMHMQHGCIPHGSSKRSGKRTLIPAVDMLMRKVCGECSHQLLSHGGSDCQPSR